MIPPSAVAVEWRYYHQDRLSTRVITDGSGTLIGTEDHLPFGDEVGATGETEKHRFTTYERDTESNTDYAINRQHQNAVGRFVQPDPVAGNPANPQSVNRYSYTANDPINFTDPQGLFLAGPGRQPEPIYLDPSQCYTLIVDGIVFGTIGNCGGGGFGGSERPERPPNPTSPSTQTRQKPIYCQPDVIKAMNKAWSQSGNAGQVHPGSTPVEAGFNLNGSPSNYQVSSSYTNEVGKMSIKYNNLNSPNPTFANFHVHPKGFDGNNGFPSTPKSNYEGNRKGDTGAFDDIYHQTQNGRHQAIQVYVMSWQGLAMYDPATGNSTQLVKGTGFLKGEGCPR
jgi:RHS repeat-associated protein